MQTQVIFQDNKKLSKQEYNKLYYQKNKEKLLEKKKEQSVTAESTACAETSSDTLKQESKILFKVIRSIELLALLCLTVIMTYFLIKESAGFYLESNESVLSAYLKAGTIELVAILFSFSKSSKRLLQWGQRFVVVLLCSLTLWTMSGKLVRSASQDTSKVQALAQVVHELETEKLQKESLRHEFLKKGKLLMTRRYEKGLDQVREKLNSTRQTLATMQAPQIVANSLGILILFRLLVMLANLICIHRLAEFAGLELAHNRSG